MQLRALMLCAALATAALQPGCGRPCYEQPRCVSFTYLKAEVTESQLLADEKLLRGVRGIEGVRAWMKGGTAVVSVYTTPDHDIAVRERLLEMGYQRRW